MIETILTRKSERDYTGEHIPKEDIKTILECGFCAPSARNLQPWSAVVVDDRETMMKIAQIQEYSKFMKDASHAILVCGDTEKSEHFWRDDCAAVTQNILLATHGLGYDACWCGVTPRPDCMGELRELLGIPEEIAPYSLIVLGVKKSSREPNQGRYRDDLVHFNKW